MLEVVIVKEVGSLFSGIVFSIEFKGNFESFPIGKGVYRDNPPDPGMVFILAGTPYPEFFR
jgi:hypothetical protein